MRKHLTITRAPFSGAPFGDLGKKAAPLTGQSMALFPDKPDPRIAAWFGDNQVVTLQQGETITAAMHKVARATGAPDTASGVNSSFALLPGEDGAIASATSSGSMATLKALKAGRVRYKLTSGDTTVSGTIIIIVTAKPTPKPAQITTQPPAAVTLKEGDQIAIKVTATGATAYRWEKLKADGKTWEAVNGKTTDTLAAAVAVPADTGSYHVVISGEPGSADVISTVCVLTVTAKPVDHLNLIESGTAPGTLTDYHDGLQTLAIKVGTVFSITVQRMQDGTTTPVAGGGNNFKIASAGNSAIAEAINAPSDTTNKRTLQITAKAKGTSTIKLTSADGQALVTLTINVEDAALPAVKATALDINDITDNKSGGKAGAKMKPLHFNKLNADDEYFYTVKPSDASGYKLKWEFTEQDGSKTDKASIDPNTGAITCLKEGDILLKLTLTNADGSTLTDSERYHMYPQEYFNITTPSLKDLKVGNTVEFTKVAPGIVGGGGTPDDFLKNVDGTIQITYSSDDAAIAKVNADGLITAVKEGNTHVHANVKVVSNGTTFTATDSSYLKVVA
ncbi:pilus assembly protein N-terminal domain-containing protein [Enterobacter huaxiensis]|uniref:pilus assembly protein N-terminal domain-containing protein n=1 Tax=Enterobacter huaxiensis TaxID=2494702 RepID=UPI002175D7AB|nr:pilus assembly protein N-terminal domain-containing protein [Enterobacter huaxiensis]MCS5452485.1 pilus assembly protein N-terminal domain-containing protein [Enterobacter huaxiensis]